MHKNKLVYFGTPAPFKDKLNSEEASEASTQRLQVITAFNAALAKKCNDYSIFFADVFKLTADKDGYNNNNWMIDARHLKPQSINELIKNFGN